MIDNFFTTMIGSDMWQMRRPDSDTDLFRVYVASTEDILKGTADMRSKFIQKDNTDITIHEIGKVVSMLLKGNLNFIIGVMSPIVVSVHNSELFYELRSIVKRNISKNCYHSIRGFTLHNYKKYIESGLDRSERRCNKVLRVLKFGQRLLQEGRFVFEPVTGGTPEIIERELEKLEVAYEKSPLPEKPNEEPFREWLFKLRLYELEKNLKRSDQSTEARSPTMHSPAPT